MRRIHISVFVACLLIVAIGYDQHSIRNRRLQVLPRLQHQLVTLENSKLQHEHVRHLLSESLFKREQLFLSLLRISRSRVIGQTISQLPEGTTLQSISLMTQPDLWVGSTISVPKDQDSLKAEMDRLVELASASQLRLSLNGSSQSMEQVNLLERRLINTQMFSNIKLQETRLNGDRVEFSLLGIVVNPYHQLTEDGPGADAQLAQEQNDFGSSKSQLETVIKNAAYSLPVRRTSAANLNQ